MHLSTDLSSFFTDELKNLSVDANTKAYIIGMLSKFPVGKNDHSKDSIALVYAQAKETGNFNIYQSIGEWVFFCNSLFPEHLNKASSDYYCSIGRLSFYACYRIMDRKWVVYEQLADRFIDLSIAIRKIILE